MKLLDDDGENKAVRWFLACYGGGGSKTIGAMKAHLEMSGFDGCWPDWCNTEHPSAHLTKGGAQLWIRHLFNLETQKAKQVPMNAVMQQALDTLQELWLLGDRAAAIANPAIESLKFAISQPPARPLENAEIDLLGVSGIEQFPALYNRVPWGGELMMYVRQLARAIEAHHGIGGEA